jgi:glycosyltransferase involved in cell wall biosynthesis
VTGTPRVALIHDYLTQYGGAEQVLAALQRFFPAADTFTTLYDADVDLPGIQRTRVHESRLGIVSWFRQHHRAALPLFPLAMRDINRRLADYDVLIADSSAWAHQIAPRPGQRLVIYSHSPARFLYGDSDYLGATGISGIGARAAHLALAPYRWLDRRAYRRANIVLANSGVVANRLRHRLGIDSTVVHPPIEVDSFAPNGQSTSEDWYLLVSRLVPHKRVDLVVKTATTHNLPVKIIGDGRDMKRLREMAGPSVEFLGFQTRPQVVDHYQRCRAFILPGVEDFGMTAVEAQASGRPVIAFNRGGARETVVDGKTGVLFDDQRPDSLLGAMRGLDRMTIRSEDCIRNARKFDESVFRDGILWAVERAGCEQSR